jgi:hypothetical protein
MATNRGGFTLVEVVIASSVLVIALFGILSMAFHTFTKADVNEDAIAAANLAAERLAYFRAHDNPFRAAGGTFYAPPRARGRVDLNQNVRTVRADLHNVWNVRPVLLVREWLYANSERRFGNRGADIDDGRQNQIDRHSATKRVNFVPLVPSDAAGVFPNDGTNGTAPTFRNTSPAAYPISFDNGTTQTFKFYPAPRANDAIRGAVNAPNFTADLRFCREVWIQTNSPLGAPYINGATDNTASNGAPTWPAFYGTGGGGNALVNAIARGAQSSTSGGVNTLRMPEWVITVTVRVFARDPKVRNLDPTASNATGAYGPVRSNLTTGWGYDPTRPLATAVGYFGVRHQLGYIVN